MKTKNLIVAAALAAAIFGGSSAFAQCPGGVCARSYSTASFRPFGGFFANMFGGASYSYAPRTCAPCSAAKEYAPGACAACATCSDRTSCATCPNGVCALSQAPEASVGAFEQDEIVPDASVPEQAAAGLESVLRDLNGVDEQSTVEPCGETVETTEPLAPCQPVAPCAAPETCSTCDTVAPCAGVSELERQFAQEVAAWRGLGLKIDANISARARANSQECARRGGAGHFIGGAWEVATPGVSPKSALACLCTSGAHKQIMRMGFTRCGVGVAQSWNGYKYWTLRFE